MCDNSKYIIYRTFEPILSPIIIKNEIYIVNSPPELHPQLHENIARNGKLKLLTQVTLHYQHHDSQINHLYSYHLQRRKRHA